MDITKALFDKRGLYIIRGDEKVRGEERNCLECKKEFFAEYRKIKIGRGKFCSNKCQTQLKNHPRWNGGRIISDCGYILIKVPNHPYSRKGYCSEHRIIIESKLKRILEPAEIIHHIDGDKTNNRINNLLLTTNSEHMKLHKINQRRKYVQASFANPF